MESVTHTMSLLELKMEKLCRSFLSTIYTSLRFHVEYIWAHICSIGPNVTKKDVRTYSDSLNFPSFSCALCMLEPRNNLKKNFFFKLKIRLRRISWQRHLKSSYQRNVRQQQENVEP